MLLVENFKKDISNSLKEILDNTGEQVEDLKEEAQNSLKELQENTTKQVMELNKTIQDLKMEEEIIKKTQRDNSGDRNPRKEIRNHRCEHQQQNTRDGRENLRYRRLHTQKKKKIQKGPNSKDPGNPGHIEKTKPMDNRKI